MPELNLTLTGKALADRLGRSDAQEEAADRLRELCQTEIVRVFWAVERLSETYGNVWLQMSGTGPAVYARGDWTGLELAKMLEVAGQNVEVELDGGRLRFSCPSWPS